MLSDTDQVILSKLCAIPIKLDKKADPRRLAGDLSDNILHMILTQGPGYIEQSNTLKWVAQICKIEWAYRRGYLAADWKWKWNEENEGQIEYIARDGVSVQNLIITDPIIQ